MTTDTTPREDERPPRRGWAPGKYLCHCHQCERLFVGDKRASECAECAYAAPDETTARAALAAACPECGGTRSQFPNAWPPETYRHAYPCKACRAVGDEHFAKMVEKCVLFTVWAAGQGISPVEGEPVESPETFLCEYSCMSGDEDWDSFAERARSALAKEQSRG